jgi:hypothetical protein
MNTIIMKTKGWPKYFYVDSEIYVKVYFENGSLVAKNDLGSPYRPYKAMSDGNEITQEEFEAGTAKRRKELKREKVQTL